MSSPHLPTNLDTFRECLTQPIVARLLEDSDPRSRTSKPRKSHSRKTLKPSSNSASSGDNELKTVLEPENNDNDLTDFIEYLATEIFSSFPQDLQQLSYASLQSNKTLQETYQLPLSFDSHLIDTLLHRLPPSIFETLIAYNLVDNDDNQDDDTTPTLIGPSLLTPVISSYIASVSAPPPAWSSTRTDACEICDRDWIPLTYHHLIPRSTHDSILFKQRRQNKRKGGTGRGGSGGDPQHEEWMLNSVAWLCSACHRFVHSRATNEELAKEWYTVEKLKSREDVQRWAAWIGRIRWKSR